MNRELLKEFYDKAVNRCVEDSADKEHPTAWAFEENFAELIVERCAAIVSLYRRDNLQDKAIADTLENVYREMKLSFGMKP